MKMKKHNLIKLLTIAALSACLGSIVFIASKYNYYTLVIQTRTLEKGVRAIAIEDKISRRLRQITFQIGSDTGESSYYTIEFPRMNVNSINIPPLSSPGKFEIERVVLYNNDVQYSWNEENDCVLRSIKAGVIHYEVCGSNAPVLTLNNDTSLTVSSIPETGIFTPFKSRLIAAAFAFLGLASCTGYLFLRLPTEDHRQESKIILGARVSCLLIFLLYSYQLYHLWHYSVDIPFWEEWEFFAPRAFPHGISWEWLFQHLGSNQQIMILTKLMAWLDLKLFNLDFVALKIMNYFVFGLLLLALLHFKNKVIGRNNFRLFPAFIIFLTSPIAYEVHSASFQSGETFVTLFSVIMLSHLISDDHQFRNVIIFCTAATLAIFSLSAGLFFSLTYLLCFSIYTSASIKHDKIPLKDGLIKIFCKAAVIIPMVMLWFNGFHKPADAQPWLIPLEYKFWTKFLNLVGLGFGFETENPLAGLICIVIVLAPVFLLLSSTEKRWNAESWHIVASIAGILAVLCLITLGRGNMPYSIILSRYAIFSFLLIPYAGIAWWYAIKTSNCRTTVLAVFWFFCALSYGYNWSYSIYRDTRYQDTSILECIERYSNGTGDGMCSVTHAIPVGSFFDNASKLGVNFTKQFGPGSGDKDHVEKAK